MTANAANVRTAAATTHILACPSVAAQPPYRFRISAGSCPEALPLHLPQQVRKVYKLYVCLSAHCPPSATVLPPSQGRLPGWPSAMAAAASALKAYESRTAASAPCRHVWRHTQHREDTAYLHMWGAAEGQQQVHKQETQESAKGYCQCCKSESVARGQDAGRASRSQQPQAPTLLHTPKLSRKLAIEQCAPEQYAPAHLSAYCAVPHPSGHWCWHLSVAHTMMVARHHFRSSQAHMTAHTHLADSGPVPHSRTCGPAGHPGWHHKGSSLPAPAQASPAATAGLTG